LVNSLQQFLAPQRRLRFFIVLTVVFAGAFGVSVWRAERVERERVSTGTCLFASEAARILQVRSRHYLDAIAAPVFAAVGGGSVIDAGTPLRDPAALRAAEAGVIQCHCAPGITIQGYFRLDFDPDGSTGALIMRGSEVDGVTPRTNAAAALTAGSRAMPAVLRVDSVRIDSVRLVEAVTRFVPRFQNSGTVAIAITNSAADTDALQAVAVLSPTYRPDGTLRAVYGFLSAPAVFATEVIAPVFEREPLFPATLALRGTGRPPSSQVTPVPNDELASLAVLDSHWTTLYQTGPMADTARSAPGCIAMARRDPALAMLMLHISPPLQVYARWVQGSLVESYLPFVAAIALAMLVSVAAAAFGAQRETELARLRSDFVSSVSHELRTPLAQILMSGESLRFGRIRSHADHDREADSILRAAHHLTALVDNALVFSRIEHHNLRIVSRLTDVQAVVEEAIGSIALLADGADTTITSTVPRDLYAVVDPTAYRQVLVNLLDNAIKYGQPGQEILIGAVRSGAGPGLVSLWVDDQGPGVPPSEASSIFEPFVRLERDRNVGIAGSGLGLSVAHHLVEQHGGSIRVERSVRGAGSRFIVELPAPSGSDSDAPVHPPRPGQKRPVSGRAPRSV
jgi:signal transduction histidine kinase